MNQPLPRSCLSALARAAGMTWLLVMSDCALAQADFPNKLVRIIIPYQAGGSTDILARLTGVALAKQLGQPVVVENRAGAGGIIGTDYVAKSAPDGYTLLLTPPAPITANVALYATLPYDPRKDLRMVSDIATTRTVLTVHPSVPAKTFKELIALIKASPGKYSMGSWGAGTLPHQIQVYMDKRYGLQTLHVPYKGESPMAVDLISGVITMTVGSITTLQPYITAGKMRAIAVVGTRRADALPEVPTFAEQGFPEDVYALTAPTSLMAPAGTPEAVVARLGQAVHAAIQAQDVRQRIEALGAEPVGNLPAEAAAGYKALFPVMLELVKATDVTLN
ncbi:MAG: tripartite tricarboxylate transporter substrate binding protein [Rhodoferax sp.]|nr:tripartite tricarboxylate transporter substrate binding protein [Rhodoferax sp.]